MVKSAYVYHLERADKRIVPFKDHVFPTTGCPFELTVFVFTLHENLDGSIDKLQPFFLRFFLILLFLKLSK